MVAESGLVLGVDTHKEVHVTAILDELGRLVGVSCFAATDHGSEQMLAWARRHGTVRRAGVEGTGSYGYRLTRILQRADIEVFEVNRPDRSHRRRRGKSDPVDAEAAARAVLSGEARAFPKDREGLVGTLRALIVARRSAVKARSRPSTRSTRCSWPVRTPCETDLADGEAVISPRAARAFSLRTGRGSHFGVWEDAGFTWTRRYALSRRTFLPP